MYVVRNRREPRRYVVAIRGTNPVASSDWLFGDLWVGTVVRWPWPEGGNAAISTSTALGLVTLLDMRWREASTLSRFADLAAMPPALRDAYDGMVRAGRATLSGAAPADVAHPSALDAQATRVFDHWIDRRLDLGEGQKGNTRRRVSTSKPRTCRTWLPQTSVWRPHVPETPPIKTVTDSR
jgi:hypothetical protein